MRFTSPKRSQTTVTAVHAVAPTFWSDDTTDAGSDESKPSTSAAPRLFAKKDLSEAPEPKVQPPQRLNLALAEAPGFAGGRDSPVSTSTSTTVWNRPVVPGSLKYTPLKNPVEVHVHPDDLRDNVFIGVVRALLKTGNVPAAPREISGFILKGNLALLGGSTPWATVSSRISQHFKRCAESVPPRKPILGKWGGEGNRKLRYFVEQDPIPVGVLTEARVNLQIPRNPSFDHGLLPDISNVEVLIRPRKGSGPPGPPINLAYPKARKHKAVDSRSSTPRTGKTRLDHPSAVNGKRERRQQSYSDESGDGSDVESRAGNRAPRVGSSNSYGGSGSDSDSDRRDKATNGKSPLRKRLREE